MLRLIVSCLAFVSGATFATEVVVEKPTSIISPSGSLTENVGIETLGGVFTPLLQRGCKVPCSLTQIFSTADDGQTQIKVFLFTGNSRLAKDARSLGVYEVKGIPPQPRGVPQIAVTFLVAGDEISLTATDKNTNRALEIKRVEF